MPPEKLLRIARDHSSTVRAAWVSVAELELQPPERIECIGVGRLCARESGMGFQECSSPKQAPFLRLSGPWKVPLSMQAVGEFTQVLDQRRLVIGHIGMSIGQSSRIARAFLTSSSISRLRP